MLHRLQAKYADKPVRFLVFPCNQFGSQEPESNAVVKKFAEKSVTLGDNVFMYAKSNLNGVACTYSGDDACTPASAECCQYNDAVYDYLLSETPPHTLKWNFDKIIVGADGKPFGGETILHGDTVDDGIAAIVDQLLMDSHQPSATLAASKDQSYVPLLFTSAAWVGAGALLIFTVVSMWSQLSSTKHKEECSVYLSIED